MTTVLMAVSAADHWTLNDGTHHPTGFWAEELVVPYEIFRDAGFDVTIATPGAVTPTVDPMSLSVKGGMLPTTAKKMKDKVQQMAHVLNAPEDLHTVDAASFDIIFYPGGHGPMEDLAYDKISGGILNERLASGKLLGLLCHSPAALLATIDDATGQTPFAGKQITALSNTEEAIVTNKSKAPWLLEDRLKEAGLKYEKAALPFRPKLVRDGNLFTGQNPQSSEKLAKALVEASRAQ